MKFIIGVTCILIFNLSQAFSGVFFFSFLHQINTGLVVFVVFTIVSVGFQLWTLTRRSRQTLRSVDGAVNLLVLLNISTAASWYTFFIAVKNIEPALSSSLINSVLPFLIILIGWILRKTLPSPSVLLIAAFLVFCALLSGYVAVQGRADLRSISTANYPLGVLMSLACGVAMAISTLASKRLSDIRISADTIVAFRFLLLIPIGALLTDWTIARSALSAHALPLLYVSFFGYALPLLALQIGIKILAPITVAFLIGLAPALFFFAQWLSESIEITKLSLACVVMTSLAVAAGTYLSSKATR
jgi:drug/metabolite transporter (DMT)-like permease